MKEKAVDRGHGSSGKVLASKFGAPSLIPSTHKKKKNKKKKKKKVLIHVTTWMNLQESMLSKRSQS
jgi:hypothetical protein